MGQYRIFSEPLGVDFMVEGPEAPNEESTFQILKQVVPPDRMIKAFEDGNKELARAAYKNGYFDQESDTGLYDAFKQAAGEVMEGLGDISKEVSLDFTASGAMTYGVPGSQKLVEGARAEQQKRRRKRKATGYQTMAEVFAGYKTIGDAGKLAFSKIAGEGDEDIDASIQFIGDMMKTQSFIDDGAAIMAEQFGDFDMYRDLKAGRVEPDKKQALAASLFVQLENPVAAVTTGSIRSTTNMLRRGTAKKLAEQFKEANSKKFLLEKQLNRLPANASDTLVKTATDALEKATKESDEILAKITPFTEQKAKAGFTNQMVGKGMQAVGKAGEHFGNLTEFIRRAGVEEATTLLMRAGLSEQVAKGVIYTSIGGAADLTDGEASLTGTGFGALAAYMGPRAIASMGRSSAILGKQLTMAETTMPFFKRVGALPADDPKLAEVLVDRTDNLVLGDAASQLKPILTQTRDLPSTVRGAARFIDRSGLGRLGTETANVAKAAAGGAALPGAFGYMAGGEEGAASAIGASAPFIAAGLGYGSLLRFNNKSDLLAKQLGDLEYHKQSLTETERANFEKLDKDQQVAISTFSQFFPDVEIRMKSMGKDGPSGAHYVDGSDSVIEINTDTNLSYGTILSHEIGHHVERHGLLPNILEEMLGNPEKGRVGIFTKIDKSTGKPKITTDENGMKHYELTDEFRELQKAYVEKLANSNVSEKAKQAYETPEQFARELFAETVAERMLSGKTSKRAGQSSTYKLIESLGDRITSGGFMRKAMHSLGMATKADGSLVQGTGILGKPFKTSKQLDNLVKRYEDETIGLSESEIREQRPVTKDDELDTVIVSPSDPIESLQVFNNGGHFKTDKDGNIIVNPITKKPEVYSPSETRRANQALARDLTESIKARENDLPEGHVTLSETEDGKLTGSGKFIDDSIIDELSRTGRYNPSQINFLREASKAGREGIGNQMLLFYYAATGKGGRKYKTLKGGYRDSLVYGITITKDGNVILDTVSLDKLQKNIDYLLKRRGNEIGQAFGGSDPAVIRKNFESMFEKYLDNHAKGIVNGTPESGITEGQKNFLNAAFGPVSKSQIADNPTLSNLGERRANTLGTYRSRRLDRIGTLNPTGNTRNIVIDRLRRNLMPGRSEADVQITDKLFMPASEAGAGKGKQAEAAKLWQEKGTDSPYFKKWFGKSKVVDENGEPLVVYHGTKADFTEFDSSFQSTESRLSQQGPGFYFTDKKSESKSYGKPMEVYLSLDNPFVISSYTQSKIPLDKAAELYALGKNNFFFESVVNRETGIDTAGMTRKQIARKYIQHLIENNSSPSMSADKIILQNVKKAYKTYGSDNQLAELLRNSKKLLGNDGVIDRTGKATVFTAFSPEQIKSATGNRGTFDAGERNILFMPASEAADLDFKISTRNPTAKNATENPITEDLIINTASIADDATMLESHALALQEYPGIKKNSKVPKRIIDSFVDHVVDNLLYLHDQVRPEVRDRSKLWYDGARNITEKWNQQYGNDKQSIAAALASLSPQKDWFMNVDLARRMLDIYKDQSGFAFDKAMAKKYIQLFEKGIGKKKATEIAEAMVGKTLNDLKSDYEQAAFIRSYDEVYNPREYQVVSPEGDFIGLAKSLDGVNKKVAWGSMTEISKAVKVLRNPSKESISTALGNAHKIRNFYNNILLPNADEFSVTIDTHAIAAALLRPLAGADLEVANNFGSKPKGAKRSIKNSSVKGISGTYGIYADAYRKAAEARGILPREMQSITWEAVRGLYEAKWKTKSNKAKIDNLWKKYENGELTLNETREQILESAGGITEPEWVTERSNSRADGTNESANNSQELYRPELGGSELRANPRRGRTNPRGSKEVNFLPAGNFSSQPANRITRQAPAMPGNRFMAPAASAGARLSERFR